MNDDNEILLQAVRQRIDNALAESEPQVMQVKMPVPKIHADMKPVADAISQVCRDQQKAFMVYQQGVQDVVESSMPDPIDFAPFVAALDRMTDSIAKAFMGFAASMAEHQERMEQLIAALDKPEPVVKKRKKTAKGTHEDGTPFEITITEE